MASSATPGPFSSNSPSMPLFKGGPVMSKSTGQKSGRSTSRLFGDGQSVMVIEAPTARTYRRRAAIAFWVVSGVVGLLTAWICASFWPPVGALLFGLLVGAACGAVTFALIVAWPVLRVFWHWLPEITLAGSLLWGWSALMSSGSSVVSLLVLLVVVGVPAAVGPLRRRVVGWSLCLVVRHRLRVCFSAFVKSRGREAFPLILWAKPTPAGERVWVWLRGGLSLKTFADEGQTQVLAVECWAKTVQVASASPRYAALVRFDITRRDPLRNMVVSPLPDNLPDDFEGGAQTSPATPPFGLDLDEVPEVPTASKPSGIRKPRNQPDPSPSFAGTDNSEYA
ncbi:hypothetical protein AB0K00_40080 [Dactylosporangium sp. NPDC049525]|uniref:hypothetical protein n=1 Tax=Dactylosporangium sp. NPDC049525 TaxID=3154730 RepID=UPI00342648AA